ncbi:MAG: PLDc N-terminal domain-containing protein [Acidimicrobiia bacterium]
MNFGTWMPLLVLGVVFSIGLLIHLATHDVPYMPKWAWALLIVVTIPLGGIIYLLVVMSVGIQRPDAEGRISD